MGGGLHEPAAHFVHLGDLQFTGGLVDPGKAVGKSLAVRKGGQHGIAEKPNHHDRFLSTPSVRRATDLHASDHLLTAEMQLTQRQADALYNGDPELEQVERQTIMDDLYPQYLEFLETV